MAAARARAMREDLSEAQRHHGTVRRRCLTPASPAITPVVGQGHRDGEELSERGGCHAPREAIEVDLKRYARYLKHS